MTVHVYRLAVRYPEGSVTADGSPVRGWQPPGWRPDIVDVDGVEVELEFHWPRPRAYPSPKGADYMATVLRRYGATVEIERSEPAVWGAS